MSPYQTLLLKIGVVFLFGFGQTNSIFAQAPKLELDDVSWLWPVPTSPAELDQTISMGSLNRDDGTPVWSDAQFQSIQDVVDSGATEVEGRTVDFDQEFSMKANWRVAGMRIDPIAPGAHAPISKILGNEAQIRLIIQPVTVKDSEITIHDTAVHLVYSFLMPKDPANPQLKVPDNKKFEDILDDVKWLKAISKAGGFPTTDLPLGVHPGITGNVPGLIDEVKRFLGKHLSPDKLSSMALMGIEDGIEPWIFLALASDKDGVFGPIPVDKPFAKPQMIDFTSSPGEVVPVPVVSNLSTELGAAPIGVATDVLFGISSTDLRNFATVGKDESGAEVKDAKVKNTDIPDVVANPEMSNFFNTDCVSCHTESQRRRELGLPFGEFAFKVAGESPQRTSEVMSSAKWNVRNFGWFPDFFKGGETVPTATQRTANETAEVLEFIEEHFGHK